MLARLKGLVMGGFLMRLRRRHGSDSRVVAPTLISSFCKDNITQGLGTPGGEGLLGTLTLEIQCSLRGGACLGKIGET